MSPTFIDGRAPGSWMHQISKQRISNQAQQSTDDSCYGLGKTAGINGSRSFLISTKMGERNGAGERYSKVGVGLQVPPTKNHYCKRIGLNLGT